MRSLTRSWAWVCPKARGSLVLVGVGLGRRKTTWVTWALASMNESVYACDIWPVHWDR